MGRPHELLAAAFGSCVGLYCVQQQAQTAANSILELEVTLVQELQHPGDVWQLEFNRLGTSLACSLDGSPEVWLWMPVLEGTWQMVTKLAGGGGGAGAAAEVTMVD
jgi:hypothetical protein